MLYCGSKIIIDEDDGEDIEIIDQRGHKENDIEIIDTRNQKKDNDRTNEIPRHKKLRGAPPSPWVVTLRIFIILGIFGLINVVIYRVTPQKNQEDDNQTQEKNNKE